jgi:hypothetical protein
VAQDAFDHQGFFNDLQETHLAPAMAADQGIGLVDFLDQPCPGTARAAPETPASNKTFIERVEKGFDFLGYHFGPKSFRAASKTLRELFAHLTHAKTQERKNARTQERIRKNRASIIWNGRQPGSRQSLRLPACGAICG